MTVDDRSAGYGGLLCSGVGGDGHDHRPQVLVHGLGALGGEVDAVVVERDAVHGRQVLTARAQQFVGIDELHLVRSAGGRSPIKIVEVADPQGVVLGVVGLVDAGRPV